MVRAERLCPSVENVGESEGNSPRRGGPREERRRSCQPIGMASGDRPGAPIAKVPARQAAGTTSMIAQVEREQGRGSQRAGLRERPAPQPRGRADLIVLRCVTCAVRCSSLKELIAHENRLQHGAGKQVDQVGNAAQVCWRVWQLSARYLWYAGGGPLV